MVDMICSEDPGPQNSQLFIAYDKNDDDKTGVQRLLEVFNSVLLGLTEDMFVSDLLFVEFSRVLFCVSL